MKKVLSFVLVLAMILGCTAMAFAAPNGTIDKKTVEFPFPDAKDNYQATILKDLGILQGDENGKANLDQSISRAEMVTILLRTLGLEAVSKGKTATQFKDVPATAWYSGYVAQAVEQEITNGVSKTEFNPLGLVSADEALAFVCKLLGYDATNVGGTWPSNYRALAVKNGLVPDDLELGATEITRAQVFEVLFAALDLSTVSWNKFYERFDKDNVVLVKNVGLKKTVAETYFTSCSAFVDDDLVAACKENGLDISEYKGQTVDFLTKYGDTTAHIIGVAKIASVKLEGTIGAGYTTFTAIDKKVYTLTENKLSGASFYYNGECKAVLTDASLELEEISGASFELEVKLTTDKKAVDTVYSVSVWSGEDKLVSETDAKALAKEPTSWNGKAFPTTKAAAGSNKQVVDYSKLTMVGAEKLSDIAEDDVVRLYVGGKDNKVVKVTVTKDLVVGAVTSIKAGKYTIDGTAYEFSKTAATSTTPDAAYVKAATPFAFYLNEDGKIHVAEVYAEKEAKVAYTYAYVLKNIEIAGKVTASLDETTATTYRALRLLPVGTSEYVDFSADALLSESAVGAYDVLSAAAAGDLVQYKLNSKGTLAEISKVTLTTANGSPAKIYEKKTIDGKSIADSAVVTVLNSKYTSEKAACYVGTDIADVLGKSYNSGLLKYYADATGKIVLIEIGGQAVTDTTHYVVSVAAFLAKEINADGVVATFLIDGEEEEFVCSDEAILTNVTTDKLYRLSVKKADDKVTKLEDVIDKNAAGKTTDVATYLYSSLYVLTTSGVTAANNVVTVSNAAAEAYTTGNALVTSAKDCSVAVDEDAVVYFYNYSGATTNKVIEVVADVQTAVDFANTGILLIDIDGDKVYDVVYAF